MTTKLAFARLPAWGPVSLLLLALLLPRVEVAQAAGGRALAQQENPLGQQEVSSDPFYNAVQPKPLSTYQTQGQANGTLAVVKMDVAVRLLGSRFVPFNLADQRRVVKAFQNVMSQHGPVQLVTYKEVQPDLAAPEALRLPQTPAVEFSFVFYPLLNVPASSGELIANTSSTYQALASKAYMTYFQWASSLLDKDVWPGVPMPELLTLVYNPAVLQRGFTLHPLIVLEARLAVDLAKPGVGGGLTASQATAVAQSLQAELSGRSLGTLVEATNRTGTDGSGQHLLALEVTLFTCRDNATAPSPECEVGILEALLGQVIESARARERWQSAGISSVSIVAISQRQAPPAPTSPSAPSTSRQTAPQDESAPPTKAWVPWHLDRIDQRSLPLDGSFTPTADGTGVNVFIISSGILGGHEEFQIPGGTPGISRVKPAWGFKGILPLEDCQDSWWYGYGTFAASLCCGLRLGPAKNATIHSVRFREQCFSGPDIWASGAMPAAMDTVLSTAVHMQPAVVLIDTWWAPVRDLIGDTAAISADIVRRLDTFIRNNLTVVAAAGQGMDIPGTDPCSNVIASHPGVISVAASDYHDQVTDAGPSNSACIDIFAPGGGVGTGTIGASPANTSAYSRVINRAFGAAAIVAGVAAQYLQLHPDAAPLQVRRGVLGMATPNAVTDTGDASPTPLLFTDLLESVEPGWIQPAQPAAENEGGGMSAGAIVGIVVGSCVGAAAIIGMGAVLVVRRRMRQTGFRHAEGPSVNKAEWEIPGSEIIVCKRPDGSDWLLGKGRHSRVYKAMKGGVQVVAVKKLSLGSDSQDSSFVKGLATMKYASRDANITQFYGACIEGDSLALVSEFMEGGDLATALSKDDAGRLQWYGKGKEIMLDVVRGAHFLHANGIVHGDINSKNILLGRDLRAKIGDVGVAQLLESQHSEPKGFRGSFAWAAPEVLLGDAPSDAKSDIFSIGVTLWEVVTGELPIRGQLRSPRVPQECPQGVADAIQACMQADPAKRPSARDLYSTLLPCPPCAPGGAYPSEEPQLDKRSDVVIGEGSGSAKHSMQLSGPSTAEQSREGSVQGERYSRTSGQGIVVDGAQGDPWSSESLGAGVGAPLSPAELELMTISMKNIHFCTSSEGARLKLGSGSFGSVYKVLLDGVQPLAAKVVDLGSDASVKVQDTFLREVGLLWRLRHRNIVSLSGVCILDNKGYLLMELMEGGSLFHRLGVVGRSTMTRVLGWYNRGRHVALDVARGLHYLHSLKITHFDLKSGNVLLTKEFNAKLADVGLARVMSCTHHSLSQDGSVGTFAYMAPELMAGTKCTAAVDIFSFGVLVWEICTGSHPVRGKLDQPRVPEDCPQAVADLILECTATDPAARPTARDLVERLSLINLTQGIKVEGPKLSSGGRLHEQGQEVAQSTAVSVTLPPIMPSPFLAML